MQGEINKYIWAQFGASIDMLESAINLCPINAWNQNKEFADFWYLAYHTLFWLDFYLTKTPGDFTPFQNFGNTELDPDGILPAKVFSKDELLAYVKHCRSKCKTTLENLSEQSVNENYKFGSINFTFFELILYNMRHVQHHTAQLNLILRQQIDSAPGWVKRTNNQI